MEDIESWIYIVVFFLIMVISFIRSLTDVKKKKQGGMPPLNEEEDMEEAEEYSPFSLEEEGVSSLPTPTQEFPSKNGEHPTQPTDVSPDSKRSIPFEEPAPPLFEVENAEDLKKAVIFSEILNRKY